MKIRDAVIILAAIACLLVAESSAKSKKAATVPSAIQIEGWSIEKKLRPQASKDEAEYECGKVGKSLAPLGILMRASNQNLIQTDPGGEWSETDINQFASPEGRRSATIKNGGLRRRLPYRCAVQISAAL